MDVPRPRRAGISMTGAACRPRGPRRGALPPLRCPRLGDRPLGTLSMDRAFRCTGCSSALDSGDWVGAVYMLGRQPCGFCGYQWLHVRRRAPAGVPAPACFAAQCAQCDRSTDVSVAVRPLRDAEPADPHFDCRCAWSNRPARACSGPITLNICRHCTNTRDVARKPRPSPIHVLAPAAVDEAGPQPGAAAACGGAVAAALAVGSAGRWPTAEQGLGATDNPILCRAGLRSAQSNPSRFTAR